MVAEILARIRGDMELGIFQACERTLDTALVNHEAELLDRVLSY
jgi:hypothetical protein